MNVQQLAREQAAAIFGVPVESIRTPNRTQRLVDARKAICYVLRTHTKIPYAGISRAVGWEHHTTALHANRHASDLIATDEEFRARTKRLAAVVTRFLRGGAVESLERHQTHRLSPYRAKFSRPYQHANKTFVRSDGSTAVIRRGRQ